jgi:hypothetical protein
MCSPLAPSSKLSESRPQPYLFPSQILHLATTTTYEALLHVVLSSLLLLPLKFNYFPQCPFSDPFSLRSSFNVETKFCAQTKYRQIYSFAHLYLQVCRKIPKIKQQTPWPESESELYRPSDRLFSAK